MINNEIMVDLNVNNLLILFRFALEKVATLDFANGVENLRVYKPNHIRHVIVKYNTKTNYLVDISVLIKACI